MGVVGLGGAALVDVEDDPWWVCSIVPDLADRWPGGHRVLMPCGCRHRQLVWGATVGPSAVFFALVAAFT